MGSGELALHPIDQAIADIQARRRARTWPPVTIEEFGRLSYQELRNLAQDVGIQTSRISGFKRADLVISLYWHCHGLDRAMRR